MSLDFGLSGFIDMFLGHAQLSTAVGKPLCSIGSSLSRLSLVMPFASCYSWITLYSQLLRLSARTVRMPPCTSQLRIRRGSVIADGQGQSLNPKAG